MRKQVIGSLAGMLLAAVIAHAQTDVMVMMDKNESSEFVRMYPGKKKKTETEDMKVSSVEAQRKVWVDRYLSVCYPLPKLKVTSPYGYRRDPFTGKKRFHNGLDLRARGDKVLAMMEGVVVKVGQNRSSGKYVTLQHGSYTISYCHLSRILTRKNAKVYPRDVVGITGSTGRSTGEHLHITCRLNGKSVNPALVLDSIRTVREECVEALTQL